VIEVHTLLSNKKYFKIHFNIIIPLTPMPPTKILYAFLFHFIRAIMPYVPPIFGLITLVVVVVVVVVAAAAAVVVILRFLVMHFSPPNCYWVGGQGFNSRHRPSRSLQL
jgi:hypothetical protein